MCVYGCVPSMLAVLVGMCVCMCVHLSLCVFVSRWCLFCVPVHGLVTSVCEQLCGFLFFIPFKGGSSSQRGVCVFMIMSILCWCFQGRGASQVPSEAAGIPGNMPGGLHAEWRLRLRCVPLPAGATLARGWLWWAGQGRGCGGHWTCAQPSV